MTPTLPDGVWVPNATARVLLPDGYAENTEKRYPVVYLLHGVGDTYTSWTDLTDIAAMDIDAIIVMPDGGRGQNAGWYSDWKSGNPPPQWETFHTSVLVPYIDDNFRTLDDGEHRGVIGNSMGGFGAMSYAARHPGMFAAAASLSGVVDTMYGFPASGPVHDLGGEGFGGQSLGTPREEVWGNQLTDSDEWRAHNPTDRAGDLDGVWLHVVSGMGAPGSEAGDDPSKPHSYIIENFIFQMNVSFELALTREKVEHTSDFGPGYHDWPYWEHELHEVLPLLVDEIDES